MSAAALSLAVEPGVKKEPLGLWKRNEKKITSKQAGIKKEPLGLWKRNEKKITSKQAEMYLVKWREVKREVSGSCDIHVCVQKWGSE